MRKTGSSLARTLYSLPVTILLEGELGVGKTTFLQGLAEGLGIRENVTSPTYALEQRYDSPKGQFLHLDLYRLTPRQALELVTSTNGHTDIRCIEWAERIEAQTFDRWIRIRIEETAMMEGRNVHITFADAALPSDAEITKWSANLCVPEHIIRHCDAVAVFAMTLAEELQSKGTIIRMQALERSARIHDLLRFVDFRDGASHIETQPSDDVLAQWNEWRERYAGMRHEPACAAFLRERGYEELARIVEVHGLQLPKPERTTIEQKLLFYADKRVNLDRVVSLEERFADFQKRYGRGKESEESKAWFAEAKAVEEELFGAP